MDQSEQLRNIVKWRRKPISNKAVKLGDAVRQLMEDRISPQQARFESIAQVWSELLPVELGGHCRLAGISGGQLEVLVDSPAYANELRWCSSQLLGELQQRCPRAKIKNIKFAIG